MTCVRFEFEVTRMSLNRINPRVDSEAETEEQNFLRATHSTHDELVGLEV